MDITMCYVLSTLSFFSSHTNFALNPQTAEPAYPTVVPAPDFDPNKDAARIDTAIKTKGNLLYMLLCSETSPCGWEE